MEPVEARILQAMRARGVATSAELQQAMGASQPTVSRALAPLLHTGQLLRLGAARAQAYALPRRVEGVVDAPGIPLVRIDESGAPGAFGTLLPVAGGRWWVQEESGHRELHDGLPWFLADMRPQGFLGRGFAAAHAELRLPPDPSHWTDDEVLKALCLVGDDLPGNLIVGSIAYERFQRRHAREVSADDYPALAEVALQGSTPGSSAGGEQPKFCARVAGREVIVKFSPADDAPASQRWRDLLVCEHLALQTLSALGVPAATSRIVTGGGRVFLEVVRFDRTARGRVGMVSLLAHDSQYIGKIDNWANTAQRMAEREYLPRADTDRLRLLEAFGLLIGNTDRHYGNISLLIEGGEWRLAPAYDMLPMVHAPVAGELVPRDFDPGLLSPPAQALRQWAQARAMAHHYWVAVAGDARVSPEFSRLAARYGAALA